MIGIYKITCIVTNECYIGQSISIKRRWRDHQRELKENIHYNKHLQRAYNKYGSKNFTYEILELCPKEKLNEREKFYINIFDSYNHGFNQDSGGSDISGEKNPMFNIKGSAAPRFIDYILQLDFNGNIINRFESTIEAAASVNGSTANIIGCLHTWRGHTFCNGGNIYTNRYSHKGYQWIYENDYNQLLSHWDFSKHSTKSHHINLLDIQGQ